MIVRLIGLDVAINPRETTVSSVLQHVRRGRLKSVYTIRDGEAEVYEAEALETSPLVGKPLREFKAAGGMIVGALIRDDKVLTPRSDTIVQAHDRVVMLARSDVVRKVEQLFAVRLDYF
jgi:trk system potassium uptake protein